MAANDIILSVPTSGGGATAAATYGFKTEGYRIPRQERSTSSDFVHNQNGMFRYRYDNGPGPRVWQPFRIVLSDRFEMDLGANAEGQWERLNFIWNYIGNIGLGAPEGVYQVNWAAAPLERLAREYPKPGQPVDYDVEVNFEEGG